MKFFQTVIEACDSDGFLSEVIRKYHYREEDADALRETAHRIKKSIEQNACFNCRIREETMEVVMEVAMTLGEEIDKLQEQYLQKGLLTEGYMIETLASEILLRGYSAFNSWVAEQTEYGVSRYYFLGSSKEYPISMLPDLLRNLNLPITCNQAYCMIPKKSVAFVAALSSNKNTHCQGICVGCSSPDCPNRMTEDSQTRYRFADMTDRPLPYGYTRILG